GFNYIQGEKEKRAVHIGSLCAPVTIDEIKIVIDECKKNNIYKKRNGRKSFKGYNGKKFRSKYV
ncbi:hypothetical protein J7K86_00195, partial [bacterium]|nr:hypothetical protein [bacterium]